MRKVTTASALLLLMAPACGAATVPSVATPASTPVAMSTPTAEPLKAATPRPTPTRDVELETQPGDPVQQAIAAMPKAGSAAPDFTLPTLDGITVTLSALRGRPVIINFWASWCVPCRSEAPELQRAFEQHNAQGLTVLGVNVTDTDTRADAAAFVKEFRLTYPIPMDERGDVTSLYRVQGLPATFFVGADGVIRRVILGQINRRDLNEGIDLINTW